MKDTSHHQGTDTFAKIFSDCEKEKFKKVLVLHGRSFTGQLEKQNGYSNSQQFFFKSGIPENPDIAFVQKMAKEFPLSDLDLIVAIGGGSIIDTSKILSIMAAGASEREILSNNFSLEKKPKFWVVPTTAGSGSEATRFAVVYAEGKKYSVVHDALLPEQVILDARLTMSCPLAVTLASGADALCQSIESFWAPSATDESRKYAAEAMPLILESLPIVVDDLHNFNARRDMLSASHLAGKAINITKTTAGHALSYGITSALGIPHGIAVLLVMGPLIEVMDEAHHFFSNETASLSELFKSMGLDFLTHFKEVRSFILQRFSQAFSFGATTSKSRSSLTSSLTATVNLERLNNHPCVLNHEQLTQIYLRVLQDCEEIFNIGFNDSE